MIGCRCECRTASFDWPAFVLIHCLFVHSEILWFCNHNASDQSSNGTYQCRQDPQQRFGSVVCPFSFDCTDQNCAKCHHRCNKISKKCECKAGYSLWPGSLHKCGYLPQNQHQCHCNQQVQPQMQQHYTQWYKKCPRCSDLCNIKTGKCFHLPKCDCRLKATDFAETKKMAEYFAKCTTCAGICSATTGQCKEQTPATANVIIAVLILVAVLAVMFYLANKIPSVEYSF